MVESCCVISSPAGANDPHHRPLPRSRLLAGLHPVPVPLQETPAMSPGFYRIRLTRPDGTSWIWLAWAVTATNAHWMATELHPDCQIAVLGLEGEW